MIVNRQRSVHVSVPGLERFCARARKALRLPEDSMTVCLVTATQIARWNGAYRGKNRPTDVLSFPAQVEANSKGKSRTRLVRTKGERSHMHAPFASENESANSYF